MPARSNAEWERWGASDPYWAVATWEGKQAGGAEAWTPDAFYALGRDDWTVYAQTWRRHHDVHGTVVDIGCGAGRIASAMHDDFDQVIGIDVSPGMLELARSNDPSGDYRLADGLRLPVDDASVDCVFSAHVFQHFDSLSIAASNLREVGRVLRPGGSVLIEAPVHRWPAHAPWLETVNTARQSLDRVRAELWRRTGWGTPPMRMLSFEWGWLRRQLVDAGFEDPQLVVADDDIQSFVIAGRT